ncbi:MAG: hypothetical protein ACP5PA_03340 [Elusimicrobiales bacterium]
MRISLKTLFYLFVIIIVLSSLITLNMPLTSRIIKDNNIYITFFTPHPLLLEIQTQPRNIIIKEINSDIPEKGSKISYASEMLEKAAVKEDPSEVFYFEMNRDVFEKMIEAIKNWKINPKKLFRYFSIILNSHSNLSLYDRINLAIELMKTNKDNILYVKMSFSNLSYDDSKSLKSPIALLLFHPSKMKISSSIINTLRLAGIDIIDYKKAKTKEGNTYIVIKSEQSLELARKTIKILNQKSDISITINPKIIYDMEIYIGSDFMEAKWR